MSNLFYRHPRLFLLAISLILVSGLSSYYILPRMEDPLLAERAANVNTLFPGADAERVEALVTEKLEEQLQEIEEIKEIRSVSRAGVSTISMELRDEVSDVDAVWARVRDKLDDITPELPPEAFEPEFDQLDIKAYAVLLALRWDLDTPPNPAILRRLAERLEDIVKSVPGTQEIDTFGDPEEEIEVLVRGEALAARGLTAAQVAAQLQASDAKLAAGSLRSRRGELQLEVDSELDTLARIARTPIHYGSEGRFVQLGDVATVDKSIRQPPSSLAMVDGRRAVVLGVLVRSTYRIDHWSADLNTVVDQFAVELPRGVTLNKIFEQNQYVESRLEKLLINLLLGGLAVVGVVFCLMGWRNALIVGATLPLASLMVLSGMRLLDIPIHQMSVTGLIIALGLLIDNAIVVVDEVSGRMREGHSGGEAVSRSVLHLAVPLFGSTLTTALAFGPIALMPGPAGEFVGSIGISVILAIGSSFLLAMTVVPAMTAWSHKHRAAASRRPPAWWREGFSHPRLGQAYRRSLQFLFRFPLVGVGLGALLPLLGFWQARSLREQFFPPADRNQVQIELELPPDASLAKTLTTTSKIRDRLLQDPATVSVQWFLGESAPSFYYNMVPRRRNTPRFAQALINLQSAEGSGAVIDRFQAQLDAEFPEARALVRQLEQGPPFDAPIEVRLYGPDLERLRQLGDEVRKVLAETPRVVHTRAELSEALPKLALEVDEEQARLAGLSHADIAGQLNASLEGALGGTVLETTEELPVRVRVADAQRAELGRIASLDLLPAGLAVNPSGNPLNSIPLTALGEFRLASEIPGIPHYNARRMNEVQGFVSAGVLPAEVLADFQQRLRSARFQLPPGYSFELGGEAAKRDDAVGNLMANVGVLMVLMVATLVLSFRSFRIAFLIVSVAALSVGLARGALWIFGFPFGFMAIVGTMGLVGVSINDAIVVLAAIQADPAAREGDPDAMVEVVVHSTRHVVATSLTTMAGFTPLVLGGGGFWPPLAVAIAGGVGGATILALYYAPACYILAMCRGRCVGAGQPTEQPVLAGAEAAV